MTKYEYLVIDSLRIDAEHPQVLVNGLNKYGQEGWELVFVVPVGEPIDMFIFKREVMIQ